MNILPFLFYLFDAKIKFRKLFSPFSCLLLMMIIYHISLKFKITNQD